MREGGERGTAGLEWEVGDDARVATTRRPARGGGYKDDWPRHTRDLVFWGVAVQATDVTWLSGLAVAVA